MMDLFDAAGFVSLIVPLIVCAGAWGVMVWALCLRDRVTEVVDGLMVPKTATDVEAAAGLSERPSPLHSSSLGLLA